MTTKKSTPAEHTLTELLNQSISRYGGVAQLGRKLDWQPAAIHRVRGGTERISAFRAGQLCELNGVPPEFGIYSALYAQSKTDLEKKYWLARLPSEHRLTTPDVRKLVERTFGRQYVSVLPSAIERYVRENREHEILSESDYLALARKSAVLIDQHSALFGENEQVPVGVRREIVARFLADDPKIWSLIDDLVAVRGSTPSERK